MQKRKIRLPFSPQAMLRALRVSLLVFSCIERSISCTRAAGELLQSIPLFPQSLIPDIGSNVAAVRDLVPHTDSTLTTMLRSKCAIIFNKEVSDSSLSVYTGYSFRIGGAIALCSWRWCRRHGYRCSGSSNGAVVFIKFTSARLDTRLCHGLFP